MTREQIEECRRQHRRAEKLKRRIHKVEAHSDSECGNKDAIAEMRAQLAEEVIRLEEQLREVEIWLDTLPPREAGIMRLRYVDGMSWRGVAAAARRSEGYCKRINKECIQALGT